MNYRERRNRALVIVLWSRQFLRLRNAFTNSVFEAPKVGATKTLLLKHYYRRQGIRHFQPRRFQCFSSQFALHGSRALEFIRQEKRAQRSTFWVRRPPGGVGVFHAKGWWPKTSCPPSKVCLPWVSKRGIWDVPRILPGCPGLSAPKSRDSLRLRRRFLPLPRRIARFLGPQDARFPLRRKSLANADFSAIKRDKFDSHCGISCDT